MSGGDEGEAPNSRRGGSCPTASLLAPFPGSHFLTPLFPVPLPLHPGLPMKGRRLTVGAVAHARRPHYSLSFSRFPLSHPPHLGLPMRGRRLTIGAVAHARRPHCSLSFSLFPLSQPPVSGSSTSTPWTTSSLELYVSDLGPNTTFGAELKSCLPSGRRVCVPLGVRGIRPD